MNGDTFTEKISQWLDDELSLTEITELQTHMHGCKECRQTYRTMHQLHNRFRHASTEFASPSVNFTKRFEARLVQYKNRGQQKNGLALLSLILGTVLLFTLIISGTAGYVTAINTLLDVSSFYQWQITFITMVESLRSMINFLMVLSKAGFITVNQPVFWQMTMVSLLIIGVSLCLMQLVYHQKTVTLVA